jgi:CubicO group peptidase (beta-lactamase class C family)
MRSASFPILIGASLALTLWAAPQPLPRVTPETVGLSSARLREATALLNRYVADGKVSGAVAGVARRGKVAYLEAVGMQDLEARAPMTERSLFRIYSMSKPVTAVAVMMLHEEGRFQLDDPVSKYLPVFNDVFVGGPEGSRRAPARAMTVRDLMLHTSGLSHRTSDLYRREQVRSRSIAFSQFFANMVRVPLMEDPGTRFRYSEATTVLGGLVEVWSGKPFDAFLEERLFRPLAMVDTAFWARPESRGRLARMYRAGPDGRLTAFEIEDVPFTERPTLIEGAVGLVSTVPDFLRFSQMLLNRGELDGVRVLKAATVDEITANGLSDAILKARGGSMGWGLGNVNVVLDPAALDYPARPGEYGWDGSAGTIFWIDPGAGLVTVLMTQSAPANPDSLRQRFKTLVQGSFID